MIYKAKQTRYLPENLLYSIYAIRDKTLLEFLSRGI